MGAAPPVPSTPKPAVAGPPAGPSGRELLARPRNTRALALRLLVTVASLVVLTVGWRVVQIDPVKLATGLGGANHILLGLVTPDLVTRETTPVELDAPFQVGDGDVPSATAGAGSGQTLTITPGSATAGQPVTFAGSGFTPGSTGQLRVTTPDGRDLRFTDVQTDANGAFSETRAWPAQLGDGSYQFRLLLKAPTGALVPSEPLVLSLSKMGETILLALMGTVLGVLISVPLSFLGARNLMQGSALGMALYYATRTLFNVGRSIEVLILAVIMAVVVGIGPFAGMMAIVLHSIGAMGKLYSEAIESIDPGPLEAITATGASRFQTVLFAVVPQVIPQFLAFTMYRWDINVRMSTVVGLVGGGGIGFLLIQYINLLQWSQAATALWLIAIVVMAMDYASAAFRARLL
jgi:phosphonate transport system permease protein